MTLKDIANRLEEIDGMYDDGIDAIISAIQKLQIDIERYLLETEGAL